MGLEERGRARMDGSGSYKGKAAGSNSSEGLWIASPARTSLTSAKHIYWFESAYDAMAYYQLHQAENKELRKAVFISTGGAPSQQQFKGTIKVTPHASHHLASIMTVPDKSMPSTLLSLMLAGTSPPVCHKPAD